MVTTTRRETRALGALKRAWRWAFGYKPQQAAVATHRSPGDLHDTPEPGVYALLAGFPRR
jgi:hypothetical protein